MVVGDGALRAAMQRLASRLGIDALTHFTGMVPEAELPKYIRGMDVVVNTSQRIETFCIANIEAMASQVPIVSFGIGGVSEYLKAGINGVQVDEATPEALAYAVMSVTDNKLTQRQMGQAGRRLIEEMFGSQQMALQYAALYQELAFTSQEAPSQ
ncbi:unnamed protein product [Chrysoparadoxa australica]